MKPGYTRIKLPVLLSCRPAIKVTLKLTVDTGFEQDTSIQVGVKTAEGLNASASRPSCADIGLPGWLPDKVGVIEPIQ